MIKIFSVNVKQEFPDSQTKPFGNIYVKTYTFVNKFATSEKVFERYCKMIRTFHKKRNSIQKLNYTYYCEERKLFTDEKILKVLAVDFIFQNQKTKYSKININIDNFKRFIESLDYNNLSEHNLSIMKSKFSEIEKEIDYNLQKNQHEFSLAADNFKNKINSIIIKYNLNNYAGISLLSKSDKYNQVGV